VVTINTLGRFRSSAAGSLPLKASEQSPAAPVLIKRRLLMLLDIIATSPGVKLPGQKFISDDSLTTITVGSIYDSSTTVIMDDLEYSDEDKTKMQVRKTGMP